MNGSMDLTERTPEELETRIAETRASLDTKVQEIERRLSPREQMRRVRERLDPKPYLGVGAAAAIVTGAVLATVGWRRYHRPDDGPNDVTGVMVDEITVDELSLSPRCC